MRRWLWLILSVLLVLATNGCRQSGTTKQTSIAESPPASSSTSIQNTNSPEYKIPILLGETYSGVENKMGTPDETKSWGGGTFRYSASLSWDYHDKPINGYQTRVFFMPFVVPIHYVRGNKAPPLDKAQFVRTDIKDYFPEGQGMITANQLIPDELINREPSGYFYRFPPSYETFGSGTPLPARMVIVWRYDGKTFLICVDEREQKLVVENKKINHSTGQLTVTYSLSEAGKNWRDQKVVYFYQFFGQVEIGDAIGGGITRMNEGFIKVQ